MSKNQLSVMDIQYLREALEDLPQDIRERVAAVLRSGEVYSSAIEQVADAFAIKDHG